MINKNDLKQFTKKGISEKTVNKQIENFRKGFPFVNIIKPASAGDGLIEISQNELKDYIDLYQHSLKTETSVKFVPASGAASRMFKTLFEFKDGNGSFKEKGFNSAYQFFKEIKNFAFYKELSAQCEKRSVSLNDHKQVLECLLDETGMNYGNLPKGLLKFHKYKDHIRTSAEEHLVEGANYANNNGSVSIHFTISPEHMNDFKDHIIDKKNTYEHDLKVKYNIDFSIQKPATDTIAVDLNNEPFRNDDGSILFRPGGHGALIENLNDIDADIIFVKNIDNVVPDSLKSDTYVYKKALAGLLIKLREQIFSYISELKNNPDDQLLENVKTFLENDLYNETDDQFSKRSNKAKTEYLIRKLNRPIRVCGMVKNEGEPGGGPFFVRKESGSVSLQIVEGAQIDMNNPEKQQIVNNATHFNPVDLILGVKNFKGELFDLSDYIDPQTGFISNKSKDGRDLKAQELPGLWNGAMANWITVFVEVPISTFNPVKVINDLLRDTHQNYK